MYDSRYGYKTDRLVADGLINAGGPVRSVVAVGVKGGGAAGTVEWYDDVNAADPTKKRGGMTAPLGQWAWKPISPQQMAKAYFDLDANCAEVMVVYEPGASATYDLGGLPAVTQ